MTTRSERSEQLSIVLSFVVGLVVPILAYRISQLLGAQAGWLPTIIAFVLFGVGAYCVRSRLPSRSWVVGLLIYIGVPFGTVVDVVIDSEIFNRSRNLFPFEILSWWMIALGPVIGGCLLGESAETETTKERTDG